MIRIYTIRGVLSMRNTRGCGTVSTCVNRHFSRHERFGRLGQESVRISIYNPKTPAYKRTIRRATTSDERKGRNYWRFHCSACRSAYKAKNQRSSFLPLTRKLRLGDCERPIMSKWRAIQADAACAAIHETADWNAEYPTAGQL